MAASYAFVAAISMAMPEEANLATPTVLSIN